MFQSMTGYGKAQGEGRMQKVVVEARSVNSRHLDIKLRLPMGSWALESMIRKRVQEPVHPGTDRYQRNYGTSFAR